MQLLVSTGLVGKKQANRLQAALSSINVVTQEQIVGLLGCKSRAETGVEVMHLRGIPASVKDSQEVMVPVNIGDAGQYILSHSAGHSGSSLALNPLNSARRWPWTSPQRFSGDLVKSI